MTKKIILAIFSNSNLPLTPDEICRQLSEFHHRSSVYSYLFRLHRQGLLNRTQMGSRIAYEISARGKERLEYFREQEGEI